jgi:predicted dehydrogenase
VKKLSKENLGVGIVGTGFMGETHAKALKINGIHVVGLLGSSPDKTRAKATEFGIPKAYESYEEMIQDDAVDVVHLTTPNYLHYPQAKAALIAGKHVACEKPLTITAEESRELLQIAREKGLMTVVNFNFRMTPMIQKAREKLLAGEIGTPLLIHGSYLQDWLLYPTDWNWRLDEKLAGPLRTVGDIGTHWMDVVSYVTGLKIVEVMADFKTFLPKRYPPRQDSEAVEVRINSEDYASVLIHFENGVRGIMSLSQMCAGHKNRLFFEINASKSSLAWDAEKPEKLWLGYRDQENQIVEQEEDKIVDNDFVPESNKQTSIDTFVELYRRVYSYLLANDPSQKPDFPTFEDGHYSMLLCDAIQKSVLERNWQSVNLDDLK